MDNVGNLFPRRSADSTNPPPALPDEAAPQVEASAQRRSVQPGAPEGGATPGGYKSATFGTISDEDETDDLVRSLLRELVGDNPNNDSRAASEHKLESLLRRLLALRFKNGDRFNAGDLREIIGARPDDARSILSGLGEYGWALAPLFTPSQLVRIAKSDGVAAVHSEGFALITQGHSKPDIVKVIEQADPGRSHADMKTLYSCTNDLAQYNYSASMLTEIATTRGVDRVRMLARFAPPLQRAGVAPDKLLEIVRTDGESRRVRASLIALDRLRSDDVWLVDCLEPNALAEIVIKGGPDTLNALRELWKDLAPYVPSVMSPSDIYELACVPDGGKGLRKAALAHGVQIQAKSIDEGRR